MNSKDIKSERGQETEGLFYCRLDGETLSATVACNIQGEALEPICKSDVEYNSKYNKEIAKIYKQAVFKKGDVYLVRALFDKPKTSRDMSEVMSKNLPFVVSIYKRIYLHQKTEEEYLFSFIINKDITCLPFHFVSEQLRKAGLERFIDPMQKAYQKVWDFLLVDPQERCGKTYPAFVK